ncbi:hypothetical protein ACHAXR_011596 [Thalassiosira sp. AJA248-18]
MSHRTSQSTASSGRHSGFKFAMILALVQLLSMAHPASAIGGWETWHILFSRLSGERSQTEQEKSGSRKISPVPNGGGDSSSGKKEDGGASNKKKHVGEVTMTSASSSPEASSSSSCSLKDETTGPAFIPRGRRGGMCLDENDICTITFVGRSNPFL